VASERRDIDGFEPGLTRHPSLRPAGRRHAVNPFVAQTLCGLPLEGLAYFPDLAFERERKSLCPECRSMTAATTRRQHAMHP
jgi:hypothetical protein